jgi:hypothetical protein
MNTAILGAELVGVLCVLSPFWSIWHTQRDGIHKIKTCIILTVPCVTPFSLTRLNSFSDTLYWTDLNTRTFLRVSSQVYPFSIAQVVPNNPSKACITLRDEVLSARTSPSWRSTSLQLSVTAYSTHSMLYPVSIRNKTMKSTAWVCDLVSFSKGKARAEISRTWSQRKHFGIRGRK